MKFKLTLITIGFIPAIVLAQQAIGVSTGVVGGVAAIVAAGKGAGAANNSAPPQSAASEAIKPMSTSGAPNSGGNGGLLIGNGGVSPGPKPSSPSEPGSSANGGPPSYPTFSSVKPPEGMSLPKPPMQAGASTSLSGSDIKAYQGVDVAPPGSVPPPAVLYRYEEKIH
jgi:hypothetical protein